MPINKVPQIDYMLYPETASTIPRSAILQNYPSEKSKKEEESVKHAAFFQKDENGQNSTVGNF